MTTPTAFVIGETQFSFHDLDEMGPHIEAALGDAAEVTFSTNREEITDLSEHDVLVDYLTDSTFTEPQVNGLTDFVSDGGGYLGIHCAADLTSVGDGGGKLDHRSEPFPELRELIGGHFLGHPEQSTFDVDVIDDHPITTGVDGFEVFDEPYEVAVDDDVRVLARMDHPELPDLPVVWTQLYGEGRVCYASLGHTEEAFAHTGYRRLLRNAIEWVADD